MLSEELGSYTPRYLIVRYMFEGSGALHEEMLNQIAAVDEVLPAPEQQNME